MLEPFTLDLCLKRNLSAAWYKGMPTIDVAANLGTLQVNSNITPLKFSPLPSIYLRA